MEFRLHSLIRLYVMMPNEAQGQLYFTFYCIIIMYSTDVTATRYLIQIRITIFKPFDGVCT
jgi:hypothetical protein